MFGMIATFAVCATFIWFARTYLAPYTPPQPEKMMEIEKDINKDIANFDKIVAEIYDRLEEIDDGE